MTTATLTPVDFGNAQQRELWRHEYLHFMIGNARHRGSPYFPFWYGKADAFFDDISEMQQRYGNKLIQAFIANADTACVGIVQARVGLVQGRETGALEYLHVNGNLRGGGIGAAVLAASEQFMAEQGAKCLRVGVAKNNIAAQRFYERHGWEFTEQHGLYKRYGKNLEL